MVARLPGSLSEQLTPGSIHRQVVDNWTGTVESANVVSHH
jgi:hypothetical protein